MALPTPTVTGFTPTSGQPGTSVTITGTNFVNVQTIQFNGVLAPTFTVTNTATLIAVVPPTATTGLITVTTLAGIGTSAPTFTVIPAPTVASLQPATLTIVHGRTGTLTVTLSAVQTTPTSVTLAGSNASVATVPGTVTVPANQLSAPVTVTAVGQGSADITASLNGTSATSTITVVNPVPAITALSPTSAPSGSANLTLALTGQRFVSGATVQFGATTLAATVASETQLSAVIPATALTQTGTVPVTVTNPAPGGGASNSLPFTIVNGAPVLAPIGNKTVPLGQTLSFTATATDPDGDPVQFAVTPLPLPPHMTFNAQTGVFSFTPDATQVGTIPLMFAASDGAVLSSESVTVTVTGAVPGAPTSLSGRVDDSSGNPIPGLTVSLQGRPTTATTNATGEFTLAFLDHPTGRQLLVVAGVPAGYANLVAPVDLIANTANVLPSPVTTPPLDLATAVTVNPAATTTLISPTARVTVVISPGRAKNADGTPYTGQLTISPVPEYGRPESRPVELRPGLSVTIQPAGVVMDPPVPITFPNTDNLAPGNELDLWSLSPDTGTFFQVGTMRVSADGQRIETISGGIRKTAWHFPLSPNLLPNQTPGLQAGPCTQCTMASQGDLTEGALSEAVTIPGIRSLGVSRDLTIRYTSTTADVQPILPIDAFLSVRAAVPRTFSARLTVGGVQQGGEVYWDSSAVAENNDSISRLGTQLDASTLTTGQYPYELTLFSNYPQSSIGGASKARILVRNERQSAMGAGWTLSGLDRLMPQANGSVVLAQGTGETKLFFFALPMTPVSWWPGDGTAQDVVGGNSGTLQNGATYASGQVGQAFSLDGLSGAVQVPHSAALDPGTGSFTIDAWVNTTKATGTQTVVSKYECGQTCPSNATSLYFLYINGGKVAGQLRSSGAPGGAAGPSGQFLQGTRFEVADGISHHIAMVRDMATSELRLYVDGQLDTSAPLIADARGAIRDDDGEADPLLIGSVLVGGTTNKTNFFSGFIDEVDFFPRALSVSEIQNLFEVGKIHQSKLALGPTRLLSPPGDFSTVIKNADGTFTRTLKDGTTYQFNAQGLQTSVTDRIGNQTIYAFDGTGQITTLTDPAGQVTTFGSSGGKIATITDPAGRVTQLDYDGAGNLQRLRLADGSARTFEYDTQHRLVKQTDARNQSVRYTYDFAGRFAQATLSDGSTRAVTPSQRLAVPNLAAGQGTAANPGALSLTPTNRATFTDAKNQTTQFETDALGRVTKQIDALNRVTTIARDLNGNPTQITRPNGAVTTLTYDVKGNLLTSTEQAIAATTTFTYEPTFNQVTSIHDPKGNLTSIAYDAKGNPLTITDADNKVTTFTYSPQGLLLTTKDALNQTTTFTYDALGRLLTTTDPLNRTTTLTYDAAGNVVTSTDALNRLTTFTYDAKNRLKQVTDSNTGVTAYAYDATGNLLTVQDAKNQVTTFAYDSRNRLLSTTDPLGKSETYTYDGNDNLTTRHTPKGDDILFAYDPVNQLLSKTLPGSQITSYAYDLVGNLTNVTDPDSVLAMSYDQADRLLSVKTDGSPNQPAVTLSSSYDQNGNRVSLTDPVQATNFGYDALNRLTGFTQPSTPATTLPTLLAAWAGDGTAQEPINNQHGILQLGTTFSPGLRQQAFAFDGVDDYVNIPDSAVLDSLSTTATLEVWIRPEVPGGAEAWIFARRDPFVSEGFSVALLQTGQIQMTVRTTSSPTVSGSTFRSSTSPITFGQWQHVAAQVDTTAGTARMWVNGQEIALTAVFGPATLSGTLFNVNQQYIGRRQDPNTAGGGGHFKGAIDEVRLYGRVLTLAEIQSRIQQGPAVQFAYDALSRRTAMTLPNGTQTTYSYDPASQVTQILHQLTATAAQINQAAYAYNGVGNRTQLTDRRGAQAFGYDPLDRLTSASHPLLGTAQAFAYDPVGNRTTGGAVVNVGNQLTADANFAYQYDDNGNLTRKTLLATGNFTQYTYDAENRLIKVEEFAAGASTPAATSTYRYDGLGRRIEKIGNGITRRYVYDGEDILIEYDGSNVLQARYTHGPGIDEPIAVTKGGSTFFYHQDGLGSVTDLTDSAGATAKSYSYDAYGNILESPGTVDQPYTYTGREFDSESGLSYYRARYYDPSTGRFLQKDPIGFNGGDFTLYAYARGNATNRSDPFGLAPPPIMPTGIGTDICDNIKMAKQLGPIDFYDKVRSGGDWDFKKRDTDRKKYEDFGNYHFGVVGRAAGWSPDTLRKGAGAYAIYSGTSPEGSGWPWPFGQPPYGDDFIDHTWINQGIKDFDSGYWDARCSHACPFDLGP